MSTYWCFIGDGYWSCSSTGDDTPFNITQVDIPACSQIQLTPRANAGDGDTSSGVDIGRRRRLVVVSLVVVAVIGARLLAIGVSTAGTCRACWRAAGWARGSVRFAESASSTTA